MRILLLSPGLFDKGGIARYGRYQVQALRDELGEQAVRAMSLVGRAVGDLEEPFDVEWAGPSPLDRLGRVHFSLQGAHLARTYRPEVVICAHVNLGPLAWLVTRASGARLIQTIYGREVWSGLTWARAAALRAAHRVIADCHNTADRAQELNLVRQRPEVVWDCVSTERFAPGLPNWSALADYGLQPTNRFRILFLGRLHADTRYKGFERLLRLTARLPAEDFEVAIAGKGEATAELRDLSRTLDIEDRAVFTGAVHERDLPDVYRSADAFYLVSEVGQGMGEGIPLTPMEAMSCGVPVLVGNADGSRELLEGAGGLCVSATELDLQAEYLKHLRQSVDLHRAERDAARQRALDAFSYERFAAQMAAAVCE